MSYITSQGSFVIHALNLPLVILVMDEQTVARQPAHSPLNYVCINYTFVASYWIHEKLHCLKIANPLSSHMHWVNNNNNLLKFTNFPNIILAPLFWERERERERGRRGEGEYMYVCLRVGLSVELSHDGRQAFWHCITLLCVHVVRMFMYTCS